MFSGGTVKKHTPKYSIGRHKKARYKTGLLIVGSGGVICSVPTVATRIRLK